MADTKKVEDLSDITVSQKVLAECLGVGDRMIRYLAEQGIIKRNSHGRYLLLSSIKNYILTLKVQKAGEHVPIDAPAESLDLNTEKAIHEHLKSMITDIKLQLIKGQVHKSDDVGRVITDMFTKFKSKMMAFPAKLAPKLEGKTRTEIKKILDEDVAAALLELADYSPSDYYSDEHIEVDESCVLMMEDEDEEA